MENDQSQLKLRIPSELKDRVSSLAKKNKRTINAEVIDCLERVTDLDMKSKEAVSSIIDEVVSNISKRAINIANKQILMEALPKMERELILGLDKVPTEKREVFIQSILNLLEIYV